ncbi:MAG: hypothetical protein ACKOGA_25135, partial [Planctomycetaceae bacterium]
RTAAELLDEVVLNGVENQVDAALNAGRRILAEVPVADEPDGAAGLPVEGDELDLPVPPAGP